MSSVRAPLAEFLGTFVLCFAGIAFNILAGGAVPPRWSISI